MSITLANMTDAELGAMVRRSLGEVVIAKALEGAAERERAAEEVHAAKVNLARDENRKRRSLITLPAFKVAKAKFAPLNVKETQWDEVMPKGIGTKYLRLIEATFGIEFNNEDEDAHELVTWRVAYGIHSSWTSPDGVAKKQFAALKKALKCSDTEALAAWWPVEGSGQKAYERFIANVGRTL